MAVIDGGHMMAGGCQCGAVRYTALIRDDEAYLCHCGMCRKATGGVSIAFKNVAQADVRWEAEPVWFRSSPIAERSFCAGCGTPLGFRFLEGSEQMDLTVGSFDDPGYFRPTSQFSIETALPHWQDTSHLEGRRLDQYQPLMDRWAKAAASHDG